MGVCMDRQLEWAGGLCLECPILRTFLSFAFRRTADYAVSLPLGAYMQSEWIKPREYSFINAEGKVFHEIAYSRQDVNTFAKMHKATSYKPTEDGSIRKSTVSD